MGLRTAVERLARRVWRERWSAIAHAEFRRNVGWHTAVGVGLLAACGLGLVGWLWWLKGLAAAGAAARAVLAGAWVLAATVNSNVVTRMFTLDDRLEVTEAWLLTSERRETILWARLAGLSTPGPLLLLGLAPLYYLAALGLPGGFQPLFVCGHFARAACAFESQEPGVIAFAAALPLAAVALLADVIAAGAAGPASLSGALYQTARQRFSKLPFAGLFRYWSLFRDSVAMGLLLLLAEGAFAAAAGGWLWLSGSWPFSPALNAVLGLAAACTLSVLLIVVRLRLMAVDVRVAARRHDEALISDGPA